MRVIFSQRTCLNANTKQPAVPLGAVQEVGKLKRNLLAAVATSSILALAAPPLALAQGRHHHHHGARHANANRRHGQRAHLLIFGGSLTSSGTAPTTPSSGAATVVSFTEGVLTIELMSDKSLIKGKVTDRTGLECRAAPGTGQTSDDDQQQTGGEDQDQSEGDDEGAPPSQTQVSGEHGAMAHSSDVGDDQGEEEGAEETCTTAALQPKAVVLRAELRIGENGAEWEKIELQR
jgi:hypothetical protein